jgi:glutamine amidotransferase
MKKVCILDYGIGNLKSLSNVFSKIEIDVIITSDHKKILSSDYIILPGVGAFANAMEKLKNLNLDEVVVEYINKGKPFMGICLGMQMLFEKSEEFGITKGLGIIKGDVIKIPSKKKDMKLPHIGWNTLNSVNDALWNDSVLTNVRKEDSVYFIHSYCCLPKVNKNIIANTTYEGITLCASVQKDNVLGVQFHPEKSGPVGLKIINNFLKI